MRVVSILVLLLLPIGALAGDPGRWVPEHCLDAAGDEQDWNDAYHEGWKAIEREAWLDAESAMCRALLAVRDADARDWRFAETLDELGLIAFQLRDFELAETVQGAAIAEMLLAVGPRGETAANLNPDCRSGVRVYTKRLGWIHGRTRGRLSIELLQREPWRVFEAGYVPLDAGLAERLDWLVSRYLLDENLGAAETLQELQRVIRETPSAP